MLRSILVLALLFAGTISVSYADKTDSISFRRYVMVGPVDAIDFNDYTVVVGDVQMRLAVDVRVRGPRGRKMALGEIQPGITVGLVSAADARGTSNLISQIHVLPARHARHGSKE
jgi:hypothetical protein